MFTRVVISSLLIITATSSTDAQRSATAAEKRRIAYDERLGTTAYDTYRVAARVDIRKPIGEFEAYALARAYFLTQVSGCGAPDLPKDAGDRWESETKEGFAATPGPRIIVEKRTGATYIRGGPKITDPKQYLAYVRNI